MRSAAELFDEYSTSSRERLKSKEATLTRPHRTEVVPSPGKVRLPQPSPDISSVAGASLSVSGSVVVNELQKLNQAEAAG